MDIVFYGTQVYEQYDKLKTFRALPDGAIVRMADNNGNTIRWYTMLSGGGTPINISDIPNEVKAMCLIMGLSV